MHRSASIASGMLFTAVIAVGVAALRAGAMHSDDGELLTVAGVLGMVAGAILGIVAALERHPRPVAAVWGLCVGMVAGTLAGLFSAMPGSFPVLAVGGVVLVAFAGVVRALSKRREDDPPLPGDSGPASKRSPEGTPGVVS